MPDSMMHRRPCTHIQRACLSWAYALHVGWKLADAMGNQHPAETSPTSVAAGHHDSSSHCLKAANSRQGDSLARLMPCRASQTLTESSQLMLSPRGSAQAAAAPSTQLTAPSSGHEGAAEPPSSLANGGPYPSHSRTSAASGMSGANHGPNPAPDGQPEGVLAPIGTGAHAAAQPGGLPNGLPNGHHGESQPDLQAAPAHAHPHRHCAPLSSADQEPPGASQAPSASSMSSKSEPPLPAGWDPVFPPDWTSLPCREHHTTWRPLLVVLLPLL